MKYKEQRWRKKSICICRVLLWSTTTFCTVPWFFLNKQSFPIKILRGDGLEAARMVGQMCIFSKELKTISAKQSFWVKSIWQVCFCKVINNIADICIINIIKCQCFKLVQNSTKCFENWKWNYFSYFLTSNQKPTFTKYL